LFLRPNWARLVSDTPEMKKSLIPSILTSLIVIVCACQKQDSLAEQQLTQQKAELKAREQAIDKRMNALDEKVNRLSAKVKALTDQEMSTADTQTAPRDAQPQDVMRDVAQMKALMGNPALRNSATAEKDRLTQERRAQRQAGLGQSQNQRASKSKISGVAVLPAAGNSPTPSPDVENPSPTDSPASP
jgi:hypothetical protein